MDVREFDFRYSWTCRVLQALDLSIKDLSAQIVNGREDLLEGVEEVLGLGFVALQVYISATEADLLELALGKRNLTQADLRRRHSPEISGVTHVEAIWAAGNYYKHHDDRSGRLQGLNAQTRQPLEVLGILRADLPCIEVITALYGGTASLAQVLAETSGWRNAWMAELVQV